MGNTTSMTGCVSVFITSKAFMVIKTYLPLHTVWNTALVRRHMAAVELVAFWDSLCEKWLLCSSFLFSEGMQMNSLSPLPPYSTSKLKSILYWEKNVSHNLHFINRIKRLGGPVSPERQESPSWIGYLLLSDQLLRRASYSYVEPD